jgi:hypothetical protein
MMSRYVVAVAFAAMSVASAHQAFAQTGTARGEALFQQGMELRKAGKLAEACDAFDASEKADPNLGTLVYLADCREANNELTTAWSYFLEAEKRTRNATDAESVQIHALAKDRAEKLEPRLSKLKLVVPPDSRVEGLEIIVGNERLASSSWNLDVPIDGKTHKIVVRAPGYREWTTTITIEIEHDAKSLQIVRLERAPASPGMPVGRVTIIHRRTPETSLVAKVLPFALAGTGVVSIGFGVAFEHWSGNNYRNAEKEPTDALQTHYWERAKSQRYKAVAFTTGGLACIGVAVWLYLRSPSDRAEPARASASVTPVASAELVGLQLGGAW